VLSQAVVSGDNAAAANGGSIAYVQGRRSTRASRAKVIPGFLPFISFFSLNNVKPSDINLEI